MIRRVQVTFEVLIDDRRPVDLLDPTNWSLVIIDVVNEKLIHDTDLKRRGEKTWQPTVRIKDR